MGLGPRFGIRGVLGLANGQGPNVERMRKTSPSSFPVCRGRPQSRRVAGQRPERLRSAWRAYEIPRQLRPGHHCVWSHCETYPSRFRQHSGGALTRPRSPRDGNLLQVSTDRHRVNGHTPSGSGTRKQQTGNAFPKHADWPGVGPELGGEVCYDSDLNTTRVSSRMTDVSSPRRSES